MHKCGEIPFESVTFLKHGSSIGFFMFSDNLIVPHEQELQKDDKKLQPTSTKQKFRSKLKKLNYLDSIDVLVTKIRN